jgi:hypothetical protein
VRPLLACLLLLAACAHAPTAPGPAPRDAAATQPAAVPAPVEDRFTPVRAAADGLLAAQGEAAWRGWTSGETAAPAIPWKGREALLDPALLVQLAEAVAAAPPPERSRLERLRAFLLGEQLARAAAGPSQALAAARSAASFGWEKRTVPVRQLDTLLAEGTTDTFLLMQHSPAVGRTLADLGLAGPAGPRAIAVVRGGAALTSFDDHFTLRVGDTLVLMGTHVELDRAFQRLRVHDEPML